MKTPTAALLLVLLSACGGNEAEHDAAPVAANTADPMLNSMDGSALQAVGDLMNSPDAAAIMGPSTPAPATRPAR